MAGRLPAWNSSGLSRIWPSVMEMTLVGTKVETSPSRISITGRAVSDPPPFSSLILAARSSSRECR